MAEKKKAQDVRDPSLPPKDNPDTPYRVTGAVLPYEERITVGTFQVLDGSHDEGGVTYNKGEIVESKCDLRRMNSPGAFKFRLIGEVDEAAIEHNLGGRKIHPTYKPENPQTLQPEEKEEYEATGMVPAQTGKGDPEALKAGGQTKAEATGEGKGGKGGKGEAPAYTRDELHEMTVVDLRELAEEEEIDLSGATKKDEIIDAIMGSSK